MENGMENGDSQAPVSHSFREPGENQMDLSGSLGLLPRLVQKIKDRSGLGKPGPRWLG